MFLKQIHLTKPFSAKELACFLSFFGETFGNSIPPLYMGQHFRIEEQSRMP